ncbi:[protein-PII] uridylyltransferase [Comamonas sp. 4034]|uniref:[protein-PII] uridylyltransferase n=1 Tax=Comamonas sp. 4034 TaxID=3156455 RepID=UPI003D242712
MNDPRIPQLREQYQARRATLFEAIMAGGSSTRGIQTQLRKLSNLADDLLRDLWHLAGLPDHLSLVAVGGFGRGKLFPHSDIDVLVLLPDGTDLEHEAPLRTRIEHFIGSCWDAGLEIGSSVRTVVQCITEARADVTVQTAMLESRRIAGSAPLYRQFQSALDQAISPDAFVVAKVLEMQQRHNKYENTAYSLEPNCKESPGGLRDLQTIIWLGRATGLGDSWKALAGKGLATIYEVRNLQRNEDLICLIRARLHIVARRREDRLVFDLQTPVAESFGFKTETPAGHRFPKRASEELMKRYYWAAKAVAQLTQILLLNIDERLHPGSHALRRIDDEFYEKAGLIEVADDEVYLRNPHAILRTFLLYETEPGLTDLSARTFRALYHARRVMTAGFRQDPVNRATFMQILQQPQGITHAMRLMNQTSVLGRYLWPFRRIVGQMQHDLFHVYTVDQHILMVLRNVRRFFMAEHAHEYPYCSQLAAGWDKPWILYLAALFHDIGKGRGGDHSEIGAAEVKRFCRDHRVAREDALLVEFLVREHLTMSQVAQKQDTSDPEVIAAFAKRVHNERYLTALYLLTVADIRGTSPKVWNGWKGKLLEDLYRATLRMLGGRAPDLAAQAEIRKREALVMLALSAQPHESHKALWDTLGVDYFMRQEAADIAWHTRHLSRHVGSSTPIVRARQSLAGEGLQVMVYAPDQPDLFARICGYFDRAGFSILDARVHTALNRYALDTFQVIATNAPQSYRELINLVESELSRTLAEAKPLPEPVQRRVSRRVKSFPVAPRVLLRPDDKGQRWLLSISAADRAGLLYTVARVLARHQLSVELAKISTLGERVEDSFLLQGPELQNNVSQIAIETELLWALAAPA